MEVYFMFEESKVHTCEICNSVVFDDGTVENCIGECGREINEEQNYVPLSFDEDDVLRELPEQFPFDELEGVDDDTGC